MKSRLLASSGHGPTGSSSLACSPCEPFCHPLRLCRCGLWPGAGPGSDVGVVFLHRGLQEAVHASLVIISIPAATGHPPGERPDSGGASGPHPTPLPQQGILRAGLEEVEQFFVLNGSCRLPLSPSLLVKGVVPRVSDCRCGALGVGRAHGSRVLTDLVTERDKEERLMWSLFPALTRVVFRLTAVWCACVVYSMGECVVWVSVWYVVWVCGVGECVVWVCGVWCG